MKKIRSTVSGGIRPKFEFIQAFMLVLVTCNNEENTIKNEGTRVLKDYTDTMGSNFVETFIDSFGF